jgi:kinetochore protein NNF1
LAPIEAELQERLKSTRSRNEELIEGIQSQRKDVEALVAELEAVIRDLEGADKVLAPVADSVREELRTS